LLNLDVASLIKVIPRISTPTLTAQEAAAMDPADLVAIGGKVISFLLQKSAKTEASLAM
jgi:Phage tail protein E.